MSSEFNSHDPRSEPDAASSNRPIIINPNLPNDNQNPTPTFGLAFVYGVGACVAITGAASVAAAIFGFSLWIFYAWLALYGAAILIAGSRRWTGFVAAMLLIIPFALIVMVSACFSSSGAAL